MGWICGSHKDAQGKVIQRVLPDGEACDLCNPPITTKDGTVIKPGTRGKGWTTAEVAEQAKKWGPAQ